MKKRKTTSAYTSFSLLFIVALLSFSSNPPNARTGAPGEGTCSGCHNSPPAGATGLLTIEDLPATVMPNTTYTLTVRSEATSGSPSTGGFQLVALDDSNINVGDLISISGNTGTNTAGSGREYMESRGDKNVTGTDVAWTFNWVSPATGSGDINMWASSVLANNNGSTSGDFVVLTSTSASFMGGGTPPIATVSTSDAECAGTNTGFATANATSGTPPYSYNWSNGGTGQTISNLPANTYFVTVTDDNSLTTTASGTVGEPSPISISLNTIDPTCNGLCNGTIQSFVTGGIGNYTYLWSPTGQTTATINAVCAGTYTLIVTDENDCTASIQSDVFDPPPIVLSFSTIDASCNGECDGSASVTPTGGNPPFTYLWDASANNQTTSTAINLCAGTYDVVVTDLIGCTQMESISITEPNSITAFISSTDATCGLCNGSATVSTSGGTPSFTYLWDINTGSQLTATATGLCVGTYSVTITDANDCEAVEFVSVSGASALVLTSTTVDANCNGDCNGSATTTATGGTPPYTVIWDANANNQTDFTAVNLCAGTYSVTVTDSDGCPSTDMVTITEPSEIVLSITQSATSCNGLCDGILSVSATGGTLPYTYLWNDPSSQTTATATGLCFGTYTVTVTDDQGCTNIISGTINEPATIVMTTSSTDVSCNGLCDGTATATTAGGSPPYAYLWSPTNQTSATAINLCAGTYQVIVTDNAGCTDVNTVVINESPVIDISSQVVNTLCFGECTGDIDLTVNGGTPGYTFAWADSGITTEDRTNLCEGNYFVTVSDANGCFALDSFTILSPSEITGVISVTNVDCFGDCTGEVAIMVSGGTGNFTYQWSPNANLQTTPIASNLCPGSYSVTVTDENNCTNVFSALITESSLLVVNASTTGETSAGANDGTATANPTGGVAPYTYDWSNAQTTQTITGLTPNTYTVTVTDSRGCTQIQTVIVNSINCQVVVDITGTDVNCFGDSNGTATAIASNGSPNYTYTWSNMLTGSTVNGLQAGTYTVTAVDAVGCSATAMINISEPSEIVLDVQKTDVSCAGICDGTISVLVTGGGGSFNYSWDNGLAPVPNHTNVCPGIYTLTLSDQNNCSVVQEVIIDEPLELQLSPNFENIACNGVCNGSIDLDVTGGSSPYSFTWNNSLPGSEDQSGLCPGVYSVTVNDVKGCSAITSVTITEPSPINVDFTIICETTPGANDGSLLAMANGGTPGYSYLWENMATTAQISNLAPGAYSLTVTDNNGCTDVFSATVCSGTCGLALTVSPIDVSCNGDSTGIAIATVGGGAPPYQFNWSNGANTNPATGLPAGVYNLTVVDDAGCSIVGAVLVSEPSPLSAAINQVDGISCNGNEDGVASVIPGGGNGGPYSILWSNGGTNSTQNNLAPTGTVRITDDLGCSEIFPYTLSEPDPLVVDLSSTPETTLGAMDGTATATPQGGTLPYIYIWNTGGTDATIIDLSPGTYSVTVTDNAGCTFSNMVEVNAGGCDLVLNSLTTVDISCAANGLGSATIDVSGGTLPYTYMWSSGGNASTETGLDAGNYTVSVLDANNCIISSQFTINIVDPINFEIFSQTTVDCGGDNTATATVAATGGSMPYTYAWSNGGTMATETDLTNTTYVVIVTDANLCMDTVFITIEAEDITPPLIDPTPPNINVYLDTQGEFVLVENDINAAASDNCGMVDIFIDQDTFDCSMVGNLQTIVYTATDQSGNTATATFEVTVLDTLPPVVIAQDIDLYLGSSGVESIDFNDIIVSASDNCMLDTFIIDRDGFGCPDLGMQTVHFVLFDVNGNCVEDSVVITVLDTLSPIIICPGDFTTTSCDGVVDYTIDFTDNCLAGPPALTSGLPSGAVFPFGQTLVSYEISDMGGNLATCSFTVTVDSLPDLEVNLLILKAPCPGEMDGSIEAIPTGGQAPYSFLWDDPMMQTTATATNLAPGTYTVEITDNLACDTISSTIQLDASPELVIDVATVGAANNGMSDGSIDVNVSGGTSPYNFLWSNGAMTEDLSAIPPGIYILEVTDANACVFTSDSIVVDNMTGTINLLPEESVSLFPNPNNGHFVIYLEGAAMGQEWQIDLFDLQGRSVRTSEVNRIDQQLEIQTTDLADGVYLFRLQNASGVVVKKLLISRE